MRGSRGPPGRPLPLTLVGEASEERPDHVVGVGPWQGPWPFDDDGELDARFDPELLRDGDRRNVEDRFRYWRHDAIVRHLDESRHDFHVAVENWEHDFNIGSVIRTANAFNAKAFHIVGRRRWNRRGAMVTDRYQHEMHHASVDDLLTWAATAGPADAAGNATRIPVYAIDNVAGSVPLETFYLPRHCALLFGQEGPGVSAEALEKADAVLDIAQFGSTRSINAGAAAAVTMHAWIRRHVFGQRIGE
ncbi:RNA methyltransferase [Dermacoccus abyssi]|uniref:RNA methyltransferase n=1 Tax=Dermacoccus abyssi TaxID=322596 RepID=A0ABX5ZBQ9_9MICO|nr:RNA methyltransferase [Dermacoccus abyssi]